MTKHILGRDKRFVEIQAWASPSVWTDQMLKTLNQGVKSEKWYSLSDKLMRSSNILEACDRVFANKGSHGVDKVSIERYESEMKHNNGKFLSNYKQALISLLQCAVWRSLKAMVVRRDLWVFLRFVTA